MTQDMADKIRHRRRNLGYSDSMVDPALDERMKYEIEREERWAAEWSARYGPDAPVKMLRVPAEMEQG